MCEQLEPIFKADYLLPRTFLATVSHHNVSVLTKRGTVPIEIYLANAIYLLRMNVSNEVSYQRDVTSEVCVMCLNKTTRLNIVWSLIHLVAKLRLFLTLGRSCY